MTQAKLFRAITVIALLVVSGLFIPTEMEVFGQEQLEHSTNMRPLSTQSHKNLLPRYRLTNRQLG